MEDANNCSIRRKAMEVSVSVTPLDARHFAVGGEQQFQLAFERNAEWILDVRISARCPEKPRPEPSEHRRAGKRRCLGDGYGFGGAGGDSLPRQAIGRGEPPRSLREDANSNANRSDSTSVPTWPFF